MNGFFKTLLAKLAAITTKPSTRVRMGIVALAVIVGLAVAVAVAAPGHMAVLASGQAWGR